MILVQDFLEKTAARLPEKTALICGDRRITYREIDRMADRLATSLTELGVKQHDRVAIFLENSPEAVVALFGILKAGGVFVLLNPGMKAGKLRFILKDCGARSLVTHVSRKGVVLEAIDETPELASIVWCGSLSEENPETGKASASWEKATSSSDFTRRPRKGIDIDLATIIYTSGSTGEPKGVVSAHYNITSAARSITTYLRNVENDIVLNALPLSFDYGLYQVLMTFLFGGTLVLEKSFAYPFKVLERLESERVTGFPIVPTMVALLLQMDLQRFDLSSLRYISNTAAALPVPYIQRLQALFPLVAIYSMYGLTECKRALWLPPEEISRRPGSVGIPIPNQEVLLLDEAGHEVSPGEIGELVVRGRNVMQGYWNRPQETADTFRPGRWRGETFLYTGDLFKRDSEGFLYFVARKDDLIKTRGERVSPKEIENVLCALDGVAEAAVIGVPDEILGQAIKTYIVPSPGRLLSERDILRHCTTNLEAFMVPRHVEIRESLPKSPSGKIDKKSLLQTESICHTFPASPSVRTSGTGAG